MGILAEIERKEILGNSDFNLSDKEIEFIKQFHELPGSVLNEIGSDEKRNQAIIKEVLYQVNENNCVLVFACSVAHAKLLAAEISMMDVAEIKW